MASTEPVVPRSEQELPGKVVGALTRRLVPFLFLLYIVAYLDRINVGFAALQMQAQLGFSDKVYGLGAGLFFAGYFLFQVPSNLVLNRVGARRWIASIMLAWGIISSCTMLVRTAHGFYGLRFLLGATEAGFFPGMILYLKNWFPAAARARTVAWFMTAAPLSGVVGGPVSGALLALHRVGGLAGWQWVFLMEGLPAVVLAFVVFFLLPDHPGEALWLTANGRAWLTETLDRERDSAEALGRTTLRAAFTHPAIWMLGCVYFGLNTVSYGLSLWLPNLIRNLSALSDFHIGLLSAVPYVVAAIAMVLVGSHSDRTGEREWHVAVPAFAGTAALLVAAYSSSLVPAIAAISIAVLGVNAMLGPFWAMPTALLGGSAAAAGIAVVNSVGNIGGFVGPYVLGLVKNSSGHFRGGLLVLALALGAAGFIAVLVPQKR